ncbi:MAG: hypothetical protein DMD37_09740 [Gemmatimonadetes bacterium]|nr:MAG: hypothetical protein DMD37_09740 [Gemmatimonadota bacterium]
MNVLLGILQGLLGVLYLVGGGMKVFMWERISQQVASNRAFSREIWMGIGLFELLCAVALVLPAATRTFPILTPIAAIGLAVEGVLFAGLHYKYAERSPMMFSLVLAALAAFVAYGRFVLTPL